MCSLIRATADSYSTAEDTPLVVDTTGGVLHNDTDVENDTLSADLVLDAAHGSLTLNSASTGIAADQAAVEQRELGACHDGKLWLRQPANRWRSPPAVG